MTERDANAPRGLHLFINDYPYITIGLFVYSTIEQWCRDYISFCYPFSQTIFSNIELQRWGPILTQGHPDKDEPWWPKLTTPESHIQILTAMIWIFSRHHATVNFGQYNYLVFVPYKPCLARQLVPKPGNPQFARLLQDPYKFMLEMLLSQEQATLC